MSTIELYGISLEEHEVPGHVRGCRQWSGGFGPLEVFLELNTDSGTFTTTLRVTPRASGRKVLRTRVAVAERNAADLALDTAVERLILFADEPGLGEFAEFSSADRQAIRAVREAAKARG